MIKRSENQARPPFPPFTRETAMQKVRMAEDGWNNRDPEKVTLAYTVNSEWRNRNAFLNSRAEIVQILKSMWASKHAYRLFDWPQGRRPHAHKGLSELGL